MKALLSIAFLASLVSLSGCVNPSAPPAAASRSLTLTWSVSARTLWPTTLPSCASYTVALNPANSPTQTITNPQFTFTNLPSAVYTVTVQGLDTKGTPIASGQVTADLTTASSVNLPVVLQYLTSGTGTGNLSVSATYPTGLSISSVAVTRVNPDGTIVTTDTVSSPFTTLTLNSVSVGAYQLIWQAKDSAGVSAVQYQTLMVVPDTTTAWQPGFQTTDFGQAYVPVSNLTLNVAGSAPPSMAVVGTPVSVVPVWNGGTSLPSNPLLKWSVTTSSTTTPVSALATCDQTGTVTVLSAPGATVTVTAQSVDNTAVSASWTLTPNYQVSFLGNGNDGGTLPASLLGTQGASVTLPTSGPTKTGWTLVGWNTQANGLGSNYALGGSLTLGSANVTLYAQWGEGATLTLSTPSPSTLSITGPASEVVTQGSPASWSVTTTSGTTPVSYAWSLNGVALQSSTGVWLQGNTLTMNPGVARWKQGANTLTVAGVQPDGQVASTSVIVTMNANTNDIFSATLGWLKAVPGGTFQRDGTSTDLSTVSPFYMAQNEVTQAQFMNVMGWSTNALHPNYPISNITWYDAVAFCNALSAREGLTSVYGISGVTKSGNSITSASVTANNGANGYRLPTEMEYDWAMMGATSDSLTGDLSGTTNPVNVGGYTKAFAGSNGNNAVGDYAWYVSNATGLNPVGLKLPNELGVYDLSGNIPSFCGDGEAKSYTWPAGQLTNFTGTAGTSDNVVRGAIYSSSSSALTPGTIGQTVAPGTPSTVGIRVVRYTDGLVGEWDFNGSLADSSFTNDSATILSSGSATWVSGHKAGIQALQLGPSVQVQIPVNAATSFNGQQSFSVSVWFESTSVSIANQEWFLKDMGSAGQVQWAFGGFVNAAASPTITVLLGENSSSQAFQFQSSQQASVNTWYHLVLVYNAVTGMATAWINPAGVSGTLTSKSQAWNFPYATTTSTNILLSNGGDASATTTVDSLRIYNRALSTTDVEALYAQ